MWSLLPAALGLAADRQLKHRARQGTLPRTDSGQWVQYQHIENPGLAGGRLKDDPRTAKTLACLGYGLSAPVFLCRFRRAGPWGRCGIALLLAGGASNLYDRLRRGTVTDMLRFPRGIRKWRHLVFNLADLMVLLGAVITALFAKKEH